VHTKIRNRLGYDKLQKLVFVHYNLKLCIQQFKFDFQNFQEKDSDPCSMMMDLALYDEGNPIVEWLSNSMSESTPILDEYDDSDDDWSTPSNFVVESLQMDAEEVAAFKQKMQLGKKKKKNKKMQLDEDEECIADDYDTDSSEEHGSPVYAESGDSSSNDEDDGEFKSVSAIWICCQYSVVIILNVCLFFFAKVIMILLMEVVVQKPVHMYQVVQVTKINSHVT